MDDNKDKVHPVGSGTGAAAGAATGAAIGTAVGGPGVGTLVGAAVGAVAGGLVGHGVAEAVNPTEEDAYWRENYKTRPYAEGNRGYEHYQPAYKYGWEAREKYDGKTWNQAENDLERGWDKAKGASSQTWNEAKHATRDAWHRVEGALPGDADRDGR
jgi:Glycine zipper